MSVQGEEAKKEKSVFLNDYQAYKYILTATKNTKKKCKNDLTCWVQSDKGNTK